MSISWYECEIMTQIHHFGCRGLSVAMIYGQGKIAESQGNNFSRSCGNPVNYVGPFRKWLCKKIAWIVAINV